MTRLRNRRSRQGRPEHGLHRVKETTSTTGTGTLNLGGASTGFRGFVAAIGNGNTCVYEINDGAGNWEIGIGTVTDGTPDTLSRDTAISNSLGTTAKINFGSGTKDVFVTVPGEHFAQSPSELTISSGAITLAGLVHTVDTEGAAASDDLATINWGPVQEGQVVSLLAANVARFVYLVNSDNIVYPCLLDTVIPTRIQRVGDNAVILADRILLDRKSGSAASYDFTKGIGDWAKKYELDIADMRPTTDGDDLWLRLRDATLGAFQSDAADYEHHVQNLDSSIATYDSVNSTGDSKIRLTVNSGSASAEGVSGEFRLYNPGAASASHRLRGWIGWATSGGVLRGSDIVGHYNGAQNPVDGIQLLFSSGGTSIAAGRAELFGWRR